MANKRKLARSIYTNLTKNGIRNDLRIKPEIEVDKLEIILDNGNVIYFDLNNRKTFDIPRVFKNIIANSDCIEKVITYNGDAGYTKDLTEEDLDGMLVFLINQEKLMFEINTHYQRIRIIIKDIHNIGALDDKIRLTLNEATQSISLCEFIGLYRMTFQLNTKHHSDRQICIGTRVNGIIDVDSDSGWTIITLI